MIKQLWIDISVSLIVLLLIVVFTILSLQGLNTAAADCYNCTLI